MLLRDGQTTFIQCDGCDKREIEIKSLYGCSAQRNVLKLATEKGYRWFADEKGILRFYCKECKDDAI